MRLAALVGAMALLAACSGAGNPAEGNPEGLPPQESQAALPLLPIGGDFELTNHDGQPFKLESLRGKVVVLFFGYTMCPDACPTTLSKLSTAYSRLSPEDRARVKAVYVTIDPERDTAEVMKAHLTYFGVDAIGLTGTHEQVAHVAHLYKAHYEKSDAKTAGGYLMSHTVSLFGIDAQGKTRTVIDYEASVDLVVTEIRRLLNAPKVDDLRQPGTLPSL
jgi:protein SCO1